MADTLIDLIKRENWELVTSVDSSGEKVTRILVEEQQFPVVHPFSIHGKLFRQATNPDVRYRHFKAMHDYAWPDTVWHYWTERRFRVFCDDWRIMTWASGASGGKSLDAAKIGALAWLAYPKGRSTIIASTTLKSLNRRVWGYLLKHMRSLGVAIPFTYSRSQPPTFLYNKDDTIHGMFAVAAKRGDDDAAISTWIGSHPDDALTLILDEGDSMPIAILNALPNLEKGLGDKFKLIVLANSNSKYDLHGTLSTPKNGWESIDPAKDVMWETTQKKGICLFFSCHESPAIYETDPVKKARLSEFLITKEVIDSDIAQYGENSIQFYRFTLGFWRSDSVENTILSKTFLTNFSHEQNTEWSPHEVLKVLAGLDPAFSYGGDHCILQLAILGLDINGQIVLDYKGREFTHYIKTLANSQESIELQIVDQAVAILNEYRIPLRDLAIDCSGQGRALAEVFRLRANVIEYPIKLYSTQSFHVGKLKKVTQPHDIQLISNYELWLQVRRFIEANSLRGLSAIAVNQFVSRLVTEEKGRLILEPKADYKKRMGAINPILAVSPDEADASSLVLQVAIRNYGFFPGQIVRRHTEQEYRVPHLSKGAGARGIEGTVAPPEMPGFGTGYTSGAGGTGGSLFGWKS